jgi:hypothetical protein
MHCHDILRHPTERQISYNASSGALAEQHCKQSLSALKPFLRENHRLGLALWVRDVAFFVQPIHSVPVKTLPRAGSVVQAKIQQCEDHVLNQQYKNTVRHLKCAINQPAQEGTCLARVYLELNATLQARGLARPRHERTLCPVALPALVRRGKGRTPRHYLE